MGIEAAGGLSTTPTGIAHANDVAGFVGSYKSA